MPTLKELNLGDLIIEYRKEFEVIRKQRERYDEIEEEIRILREERRGLYVGDCGLGETKRLADLRSLIWKHIHGGLGNE